jgi:hypothetical protein
MRRIGERILPAISRSIRSPSKMRPETHSLPLSRRRPRSPVAGRRPKPRPTEARGRTSSSGVGLMTLTGGIDADRDIMQDVRRTGCHGLVLILYGVAITGWCARLSVSRRQCLPARHHRVRHRGPRGDRVPTSRDRPIRARSWGSGGRGRCSRLASARPVARLPRVRAAILGALRRRAERPAASRRAAPPPAMTAPASLRLMPLG